MELRTLRPGEREALLDLLDGWELPDGWRGRDFFRRHLENDPSYRDANVHVAAEGGRLLACVQVFPRPLRVAGRAVPHGGIGSVYTRPEQRRRGLGGALLERAAEAMRAEGHLLSLLFTGRRHWYARHGWQPWPAPRAWLARPDDARAGAGPGREVGELFRAERDLAAVAALHEAYSGALEGTVVRDAPLWRASLANAGNPDEDFRVARAGPRTVAYARAARLQGVRVVTEYGRAEGGEAARTLGGLLEALADPAALAVDPALDPPLARALALRGLRTRAVPDRTVMLRCLDADALAARLGTTRPPSEEPAAWLEHVLPPERLAFWPSDRF